MPDIEKKLRIQLFDDEFNMLSDRLVTQYTEFNKGPGEIHKGPMKVEVCLFSKEDVDLFSEYLKLIQGSIPMETFKQKRGRKKAPKGIEGFRDHIIEEIKEFEKSKDLIAVLRDNDFIFTSLELLRDLGYPISVSKIHRKGYKFMARITKKAKNPIRDKYDPSLLIGFKGSKMIAYSGEEVILEKAFEESVDAMIKVPARAKVRFPEWFTTSERNNFRAEMKLLIDTESREPSRFYKRWVWEVKRVSPEEIDFPRLGSIAKPNNQ